MKQRNGISRRKNMAYIGAAFLITYAGSYADSYLKQLQTSAQLALVTTPLQQANSTIPSIGE